MSQVFVFIAENTFYAPFNEVLSPSHFVKCWIKINYLHLEHTAYICVEKRWRMSSSSQPCAFKSSFKCLLVMSIIIVSILSSTITSCARLKQYGFPSIRTNCIHTHSSFQVVRWAALQSIALRWVSWESKTIKILFHFVASGDD